MISLKKYCRDLHIPPPDHAPKTNWTPLLPKAHCCPERLMLITKQKDVVVGADIIIILPSKCCIYH